MLWDVHWNGLFNTKSRKSLNYGSIIILPDPDEDGINIEGLVLNFFRSSFFLHFFNPVVSNLKDFPFISSMKIPIIKVIEKPLGKEEEK